MEAASYIGTSHLTALRRRMDIVANNMANMNTPGFKAEAPLFTPHLEKSTFGKGDKIAYVEDFGLVRDLSMGTFTPTGNPLDLAINGQGYFTIKTPQGTQYGRAGSFQLDPEGTLTTKQGYEVLDADGNAINIPENTKNITVTENGVVNADNVNIGRIQPVQFADPRQLAKLENGLYSTRQEPEILEVFEIQQGMIESSNVESIVEMTNMIEINRAYTSAKKFVDSEHDRMRLAIRKLSGNE